MGRRELEKLDTFIDYENFWSYLHKLKYGVLAIFACMTQDNE